MKIYLYSRELPERGSLNMAFDEFLLKKAGEGGIHLRLYGWDKITVSIGYPQSVSRSLDLDFLQQEDIPFVRRITGGKAVVHHNEITYAVASAEQLFFENPSPLYPYIKVAEALKKFLSFLSLQPQLAQGNPSSLSRTDLACFSFPAGWEVKVKGRKVISAAMKRLKRSFMIHGTIPLCYDRQLISRATKTPLALLERSFYSLCELLPSLPPREELEGLFIRAFSETFSAEVEKVSSLQFREEILALEARYTSREWNFRVP